MNNAINIDQNEKEEAAADMVSTQPDIKDSDVILENILKPAQEPSTSDLSLLSDRELKILHLIISGSTNKEIARMLCRTQRTVEYHRNSIMKKLDAHTAVDLVHKAMKLGLL